MARKHSVFIRRVRRLLKHVQVRSHSLRTVLILLAMFLGTGVLPPTFSYIAAENSIVQGLPDAQALVQQGRNLYKAERFNDAASVFQQAAAAFKATGDRLQQAMTLSNLSLAYQQLGQWPQARQAIRNAIASLNAESLNLLQTGQNLGTSKERTLILAQTLDVQGRLQLAQGEAEAALTTWRHAASIHAQVGDESGVTRSRINSAQALQALGLYRQAQKTLTSVHQTLQKQPDSPLKATGLRSLGNVLQVVGDLEKSRQVLEQSRDVATRSQFSQGVSDALLSLGNTARAQHDTQAAINFYQQAATASAKLSTRIQAQLNQLSLLIEDKQLSAAEALWPQIQQAIANLPPSQTAVYARINFAQSLMKLGRWGDGEVGRWGDRKQIDSNSPLPLCTSAPLHLCTSAQLLAYSVQQAKNLGDQRATSHSLGHLGELYEKNQQWSDAAHLTQQALLIAQAIEAPDIAYRWQWQMGRLLREQGNIQGAIAAYTEAVKNLKSLRNDLVAINPEVQFDFRDEVEPVYRELVDLLLQPPQTPPYQEGDKRGVPSQINLQLARETIESLQLAELENFFRSACLDAKPEQIDRLVDSDDQKAAVIYPIILSDRLEVILKLPTQPLRHYVTYKSQSEVESILKQLRQYVREVDRINDVKKLSQQVYSWLIQPLEAELEKSKVGTLVFVLDGSLRNIPMAVLYDDKHKQYLIEKYAIALSPGLQLLEPKPLQRKRLSVLTAGLGEFRSVEGREFAGLENVRLELSRIQSEVPRSKELFNQAFTKTNLQNQLNSATYSVVHMATHGKFSSNLDQTFILTWDQLLKIKDLDNLLRQSDSSWSNTIELLVLSACQTAVGDNRAALGLAGVAMRAGARSTLATLWQVDDRSTAEFMIQFYRELLKNKVTKAEALQQAQVALLTNYRYENYESPYYWAPYVLLGNWF